MTLTRIFKVVDYTLRTEVFKDYIGKQIKKIGLFRFQCAMWNIKILGAVPIFWAFFRNLSLIAEPQGEKA